MTFDALIVKALVKDNSKASKTRTTYFFIMNLLYVIVAGLSFNKTLGPFCSVNQAYPPVMSLTALLFWINTIFHFYLEANGYFMIKTESSEQKMFQSQMQVYLKY